MRKLVICCALLLMAFTLYAQAGDGTEKAIADMEHQWAAAAKTGNADAIAPMLADNFVNLDSDGTMHNKAETVARFKTGKWDVNEIGDVKVTMTGTTAIASGSWHGKGVMSGKPVDAKERWVDTWVKGANGKWLCVASASAPAKM